MGEKHSTARHLPPPRTPKTPFCFSGSSQRTHHCTALWELALCGLDPFCRVVDTLELARRKLPRVRQTLDGLCDHFRVSRRARDKHSALLNAKLLAEVYAHLTDRMASQLLFDLTPAAAAATVTVLRRPATLPPRVSEAELAAHAAFVAGSLG